MEHYCRKSLNQVLFLPFLILALMVFPSIRGQYYEATRLNDNKPIITQLMFTNLGMADEGENINGPSLIRIPDWIPPENRADPSALYYLYFAHHQGDYIRMAWSDNLLGTYHLYGVGSGFPVGQRGVLDLGADDRIDLDNSITIHKHVASPDVHVDDSNKQIILYFHGPTLEPGGQRTFVSTSPDGLSFQDSILPVILGGSYFKVFEYKDTLYSVDNRADIYRGGHVYNPWSIPPGFDFMEMLWSQNEIDPFQKDLDQDPDLAGSAIQIRHVGVHVEEDTLFVFYSRIGDSPERIMLSAIRLDDRTFEEWDPTYPPREILHPEYDWEGYYLPIQPSEGGSAKINVHQLRDPDVFEDIDGSLYLLYTGSGEGAIGIARLERTYGYPVSNRETPDPLNRTKLEISRISHTAEVSFSVQSVSDAKYEIRIYNIQGILVDIIKGTCLADGSARAEWLPGSPGKGIYIANLITIHHSVSVIFHY